jgi:hypothetical protein
MIRELFWSIWLIIKLIISKDYNITFCFVLRLRLIDIFSISLFAILSNRLTNGKLLFVQE